MFPFEEEFQLAVSLAQEAGRVFLAAYHADKKNVEIKTSSADLVTETDKAIEDLIRIRVKKQYPDHGFIGEESVDVNGKVVFDDRPTWIVDPIDGTMNFVHRFPHSSIVIGFSADRTAQFGVVYNPVLDELYTGKLGHGAHLNGFPISVSGTKELNKALLACNELVFTRDTDSVTVRTDNIRAVSTGPDACHGLRMPGSAALNMCAVARGALDGYWEFGLHIWDMAAASVVLKEAGGVVISPVVGEEFDLLKRRVVAAGSPELGRVLREKIQSIDFPSD